MKPGYLVTMADEKDPETYDEQKNGPNSAKSPNSLSDCEDAEILNTFNNLSVSKNKEEDEEEEEEEEASPHMNGFLNGNKKIKQKIFQKQAQPNDTSRKWKPGGQCLAIYTLDGLYYEATILSVDYAKSTVQVKFTYYGNEETINMKNLLPMESKSEMSIVPNNPVYMNGVNGSVNNHLMSSDYDTRCTSNTEKTNRKNNWRVSDICFVLNRRGDYQQAVINSFKSIDTCHVTIITTNKRKEVKISNLYTSIPYNNSNNNHSDSSRRQQPPPPPPPPLPRKSSNCHCHSSGGEANGYRSDEPPMYIAPPPATLKPLNPTNIPNPNMMHNSGLPNPNFVPPFSPWQMSNSNTYNVNRTMNSNSNIPKCPPLPVLSDEVIAGNEEALANMLMSWYISGFHTGYYQGMQKQSPKNNNHNECNGTNNQRRGSEARRGPNRGWGNTLV